MYVNQIYNERMPGADTRLQRVIRRKKCCIGFLTVSSVLSLLALVLILVLVVFKRSDAEDHSSSTVVNDYTSRNSSISFLPVQTTANTFSASRSDMSTMVPSSATTSLKSTTLSTVSSSITTERMVNSPATTTTKSTTKISTSVTPMEHTTYSSSTTTTTGTTTTTETTTTTGTTTTTETTTTTGATTTTETTTTTTATMATTLDPYTTCQSGFKLIHFDELPSLESNIPTGYQGLNWTNAGAFNVSKYGASGYRTVLTSTPNVAYNGNGNPMTIAVGPSASVKSFSIQSFIVAAAWSNNLQLLLTGYRGNTAVYNQTMTLQTTSKVLLSLNWISMTRMTFTTSGGLSAGYGQNGTHVGIDNMCLSTSAA